MGGNAVVFIIGMFVAAIVGIAASFAMESVAPKTNGAAEAPDNSEVVVNSLNELRSLERTMQARIDELTASVDALNSQMQELGKSVQSLGAGGVVAAASGDSAQPANPGNIDSVINRVLNDRDKRREEEREEERTKRNAERQERFKEMVTGRVDTFAQDKGWDAGKTESVKQILSEYAEKMSGAFGGGMRGMRRGLSDEMRKLMDDTRTRLLDLMSEEEANELLRSATGFGGGYRRPGGGDRQPGGGR